MSKRMKLSTLGLVPALLIIIAAPMTVQAGTLTIYNEDCTHLKGLKRKKFVTVKVKGDPKCTNKKVQVPKGETRVVNLIETTTTYNGLFGKHEETDEYTCKYYHRAKGNPEGYKDVAGDQDSSVTCTKSGWFNACECIKD